ncbi:MAG: oxidative damage protection protein [Deltaproteobacteria bacterium]|nr:MAG: oxidative damage protection protein [Deltaproteobacteria bacterium]
MTDTPESGDRAEDDASVEPAVAAPRMVQCVKFGKPMEGLAKPPLKGEIGQKVFDQVSKEAWQMWIEHSKMVINEYRLDPMTEHGQQVWMAELDRYFWGEGAQLPPEFVPQDG